MAPRTYNFNFDWKFCDHDCEGQNFDSFASDKYQRPQWVKVANNGLARQNFDDRAWADVKLPHDFVIEKCEFTPEESDSVGSLRKGAVWYRKTFVLPKETEGKRVFVRFDGVFRDSQVWCNGHFIGRHLGGYLGFTYELTEVLNRGGNNTIAVFVDARDYEGWWYEGGGIYRDAFLIATSAVTLKDYGVFVKPYDINVAEKTCALSVELEIDSNQFTAVPCDYTVQILDPAGACVAQVQGNTTVAPLAVTQVAETLALTDVALWDVEHPVQYTANVTLHACDEKDEVAQKFGVRLFEYDVENGLKLNGVTMTLNGACGHDDFAGVGTALSETVLEHKVKTLQAMGCNSYRCSHNPPSPLFLDVCDRLGFIVMDEHRLPGTSAECIEDFQNWIKRDRNHPSVLFYSMGNEEMAIQNTEVGVAIFSKLIALGTQLDDSRDFLYAVNCDINEILKFMKANGYNRHIHGVNYLRPKTGESQHALVHETCPNCCFVSTETSGVCTIRGFSTKASNRPRVSDSAQNCGVWRNKAHDGMVTCYGDCGPFWGWTPEEALKCHDGKPYFLGQYLWTGFDYRGEVFPYEFPAVITSFGILDLCGFFKDWAYYTKAWWGKEDVLHIFPSWNLDLAEGEMVSVWAFSNCDAVELFLNGVSQGKQDLARLGHLEWDVPYYKGELKAVGYRDGVEIMTEVLRTSGAEYAIVLQSEKTTLLANHDDASIITVQVVDEAGNYVTDSEIEVQFSLEGPASVKGTGNGNPTSLEHDKAPKRKLFAGKAMVIIEGTFEAGDVTVTATAQGVKSAQFALQTMPIDTVKDYVFGAENQVFAQLRERYLDL